MSSRTRWVPVVVAALLLGCTRTAMVTSPPTPPGAVVDPSDWPAYNRTLSGDRYSPLSDINRANVGQLRQVCAYTLPEVTSLQTGPVVVSGTMYFTTDTISYAIDAGTCTEKWKQVRHSATPGFLAVHRGFAYMDGRLFRGTSDTHVIALDPSDGHTLWDYEIKREPGATFPMAPIAYAGLVFVGNAGGDQTGVTGHVYALDARDGHLAWRFDVVPNTPTVRATWPNAAKIPVTGGGFWTSFTLDAANGILYVPSGNPAPDFDVEMRGGGAELYTNSVIAIDAATGRLLGYNQVVKDDNHDWDVDSPPTLARTKAGRNIVASSNKNGLLSVLDRGRMVRGVQTPESALGAAMPLMYEVPTTTRENVSVPLSRAHKTRFCPGIVGGTEWNGAAYHPGNNTLYTGAVDWCVSLQLGAIDAPPPELGVTWLGAVTPFTEIFEPPEKATGWVTAVDADNGSVRWKFHASKPILAAVTPTAGGLLFTADMGGMVFALDADDGRVLWRTDAGQSTGGGVVSYSAGGKQLIGIASGMKSPIWPGGADKSRIVVFGLR